MYYKNKIIIYEIRNTLLKKAQSLNIKVDKDYEIVHIIYILVCDYC